MKNDNIIILFNNFGSSNMEWDYSYDGKSNLKKINFIDTLKEIGNVYIVEQKFSNINYYAIETDKNIKKIKEKYKLYNEDINFLLEDLDYINICQNVYNKIKIEYGNGKKYIVIGFAYGAYLALLFSKLFKKETILCCCLNNEPHLISYYKKHNMKEHKDILKLVSNNEILKKQLDKIKKFKKDIDIENIFKFIEYKSCQDRIKYYDKKLYVKTLFFKSHNFEPEFIKELKLNTKENNFFKNDKNLINYLLLEKAPYKLWYEQSFKNIIIQKIKQYIKL